MRKDLKVSIDSAKNTPLPITNLVHNLMLMGKEFDDLDFSSISKLYDINR